MSKGRTKKSKGSGLGRSLIKDRNRTSKRNKSSAEGWRHTSELDDGYDWGRLNLRSVTEESKLDEFLNTAELAGLDFKAEKLNVKVVDTATRTGLPTAQEREESRRAQQENMQYLRIPRRPEWDSSTTAEELELRERESFLTWRRGLAKLQEDERLILTPFERNLEFWRQLWRVVERSDVLVQIVDARNPLLFRCEDLEKYALEVNAKKVNVILISKADLLTPMQRQAWAEYFQQHTSIVVAFWSALMETEDAGAESADDVSSEGVSDQQESSLDSGMLGAESPHDSGMRDVESPQDSGMLGVDEPADSEGGSEMVVCGGTAGTSGEEVGTSEENGGRDGSDKVGGGEDEGTGVGQMVEGGGSCAPGVQCSEHEEKGTKLLSREELIELFHTVSPVARGNLTTVGMVGYPNVGKSSTINALFQGKKVPVSATPGRTKHFQTLYLSEDLMLCDCPGLVFPSFLSSKADMICSGILPIDQLRDHTPPVSLVCEHIPRHVLERTYGIEIPCPAEGEEQDRPPFAHELLSAYGYMRGFMSSHGRPDEPRSARYILKDYVSGKLLYCHPPPGQDETSFNQQLLLPPDPPPLQAPKDTPLLGDESKEISEPTAVNTLGEFDSHYFRQGNVQAVSKGGVVRRDHSSREGKPWKKHNNKHKREKTRRTHPNLY